MTGFEMAGLGANALGALGLVQGTVVVFAAGGFASDGFASVGFIAAAVDGNVVGGPSGTTEVAPGIEGTVEGLQTPFGQLVIDGFGTEYTGVPVPGIAEVIGTLDIGTLDIGAVAIGDWVAGMNAVACETPLPTEGLKKVAGATLLGEDIVASGNVDAGPELVPAVA
jgi:hypothetical protein